MRGSIFSLLFLFLLSYADVAFSEQKLDSDPDFFDRLYIHGYEKKSGQSCKQKFTAPDLNSPALNPTCPKDPRNARSQNIARQSIAQEKAAFKNYDNQFFAKVRDDQLNQSRCAENYVSLFDQNRATPNIHECVQDSKDAIEMALRYAQMPAPGKPDPVAVKFQEFQLHEIYQKMHDICKEEDNVRYNDNWAEHAAANLRQEQEGINSEKYLKPLREELEKSRAHLTYSTTHLAQLQYRLWSGMDPIVQNFVRKSCKTKLSESDFVKQGADRSNPNSFQRQVIDPLRNKNNCRMKMLEQSGNPVSPNARRDLVKTGVAFAEMNKLGDANADFRDYACYVEGVYGSGRDIFYRHVKDGGIYIGTVLTLGTALVAETATLAAVGTLTAVAGIGVEIQDRGICGGGGGLSSVVSPEICEALPYAERTPFPNERTGNYIQIVSKDLARRNSCTGEVAKDVALIGAATVAGNFNNLRAVFADAELTTLGLSETNEINWVNRARQLKARIKTVTSKSSEPALNARDLKLVQRQINDAARKMRDDLSQLSDSELDATLDKWIKQHHAKDGHIAGLDHELTQATPDWAHIAESCKRGDCQKFINIYNNLTEGVVNSRYILEIPNLPIESVNQTVNGMAPKLFDQLLFQTYAERHMESLGFTSLRLRSGNIMSDLVEAERREAASFGNSVHNPIDVNAVHTPPSP